MAAHLSDSSDEAAYQPRSSPQRKGSSSGGGVRSSDRNYGGSWSGSDGGDTWRKGYDGPIDSSVTASLPKPGTSPHAVPVALMEGGSGSGDLALPTGEKKKVARARAASIIASSVPEVVKFNVGGRKFETLRSTILAYPDTMLGYMLEDAECVDREIFIDRDPDVFSVILNYYRTGRIVIPPTVNPVAVELELEYFIINVPNDAPLMAEDIVILRVSTNSPLILLVESTLTKEGTLVNSSAMNSREVPPQAQAVPREWALLRRVEQLQQEGWRVQSLESPSGHRIPNGRLQDETLITVLKRPRAI